MKFTLFILSLIFTTSAFARSLPDPTEKANSKVLLVIFENENLGDVLQQPYFKMLADKGSLLAQYKAITHPSQGNYIALTSGDLYGVHGDSNVNLRVRHIGDLLEEKGKTWKAYLEDYPGDCYNGARTRNYVRKHNPFISYLNIQRDPERCNLHLVNADAFSEDLASAQLPDFSFYVPDLRNDGHDTNLKFSNRWASQFFKPILENEEVMKDLIIVITFDEGTILSPNIIYTTLLGHGIKEKYVSQESYSHFDLLRTLEELWGLGTLGREDERAKVIEDIWEGR